MKNFGCALARSGRLHHAADERILRWPGGFKYNPGTALNDRYKGAFFLCEFPVQKVTAFKTEPKGAYFKMVDEHIFLFGMMASAINFGPDGSLYVANWDGKWQPNELGSIWMVDDPAIENRSSANRSPSCSAISAATQIVLVYLLAHADQRIRLEAQFELARRDRFDELLGLATDPKGDRLARVHAMWGLGQLAPTDSDKRLAKRLPFADIDARNSRSGGQAGRDTRADFSHAKTGGSASRQERPGAVSRCDGAWPSGQPRIDFPPDSLSSSATTTGRLHPARGYYGTDRQR